MGDYHRVTHECTLDSMRPELATAIHAHIEKYELEDIVASVLICCETISTKQKKKLFGSKTEVEIGGVILTPKWLIWAGGKENEEAGVFSARLQNLQVEDYEKTNMYKMIPDTGLSVFGFQTANDLGSVFIGLGSEPAAQKFRDMLKEAILQV
jgi:hypothetical protein